MEWKLLLATAVFLLTCGCISEQKVPAASTTSETESAVIMDHSQFETETWVPYYTGGEQDWDWDQPWQANDPSGSRSFDQEDGLAAYFDLYLGVTGRTDYGGCYINCSGTLTVLVLDPTEELAEEYAAKSKTGFWIIEAEYAFQELKDTADTVFDEIVQWIEPHPESYLQASSWCVNKTSNRVIIEMSGPSLQPLTDALDIPGCVTLDLVETGRSADPEDIPREPETVWEDAAHDIQVSMAQPSYPIGTKSVAVILENKGDGTAMYGESFSMEKYIDGQWQDISGNLVFNAMGYGLEAHARNVLELSTVMFPGPLGPGLYRVLGDSIRWGPADSSLDYGSVHTDLERYVVEFTVTEDAPQPQDISALEAMRSEDQWYTPYELADQWLIGYGSFHELNGPYMVIYWPEDAQLHLVVCDRSTGESLTPEQLTFDAGEDDIIVLPDSSITIRAADTVWQLWVEDGTLIQNSGAEFPDTAIPYAPISEAEALDGGITAAMEQAVYPAGT